MGPIGRLPYVWSILVAYALGQLTGCVTDTGPDEEDVDGLLILGSHASTVVTSPLPTCGVAWRDSRVDVTPDTGAIMVWDLTLVAHEGTYRYAVSGVSLTLDFSDEDPRSSSRVLASAAAYGHDGRITCLDEAEMPMARVTP